MERKWDKKDQFAGGEGDGPPARRKNPAGIQYPLSDTMGNGDSCGLFKALIYHSDHTSRHIARLGIIPWRNRPNATECVLLYVIRYESQWGKLVFLASPAKAIQGGVIQPVEWIGTAFRIRPPESEKPLEQTP